MSDIFISYSSHDLHRIEPFIKVFERKGWSVWWDMNIPPGKMFDEVIEAELEAACCVIVLWSKNSVLSPWVRIEAAEAVAREILVPVLIDDGIKIPLEFRRIQAARLMDWDGKSAHIELNKLLGSVASILKYDQVEGEESGDYNWAPPVDLMKVNDGYILAVDVPGISPDEVEIMIQSRFLVVSGIRRDTFLGDESAYLISEHRHSRFYRKVSFPEVIEGWRIELDYRDGIMRIRLAEP